MLTELARSGRRTRPTALDEYEYTRVLDRTEAFFWSFCDNYLELVKSRRYGDHGEAGAQSANRAMQAALSVMLRLFAPVPAVCDRRSLVVVAQGIGPSGAVAGGGATSRPSPRSIRGAAARCRPRSTCCREVRRAKSEAKRPLKAAIARAVVRDTPERLAQLEAARPTSVRRRSSNR